MDTANLKTDGGEEAGEGTPDPASEISRLHEVIQSWFRGETDQLAPFADALAPTFRIVSPDGTVRPRSAVIDGMRQVQGSHAAEEPPFVIEIRAVRERPAPPGVTLVIYEEHQRTNGDWQGRISSALLRVDEAAPGDFSWVHLHETWLPSSNSQG